MEGLNPISLELMQESAMEEHGKFRGFPTDFAASLTRQCVRTFDLTLE
jgi:hypothetical protein